MEIVSFNETKFLKKRNFSRVHGDVFRPPKKSMLLSVLLGNGIQIAIMSLITLGKIFFYFDLFLITFFSFCLPWISFTGKSWRFDDM
jgi:hypothetical protein